MINNIIMVTCHVMYECMLNALISHSDSTVIIKFCPPVISLTDFQDIQESSLLGQGQ